MEKTVGGMAEEEREEERDRETKSTSIQTEVSRPLELNMKQEEITFWQKVQGKFTGQKPLIIFSAEKKQ